MARPGNCWGANRNAPSSNGCEWMAVAIGGTCCCTHVCRLNYHGNKFTSLLVRVIALNVRGGILRMVAEAVEDGCLNFFLIKFKAHHNILLNRGGQKEKEQLTTGCVC